MTPSQEGLRIVFSQSGLESGFSVSTKASVVDAASLDAGGFRVSCTSGAVESETMVWNDVSFTKSGSSFHGDKWWPDSNPGYHFYASNSALTFDADGCTVSASTATDVVCAYMQNPTYKTENTLSFDHIFARIGNMTVVALDGYTISNVSIRVTPKISGTYNIRTGAGQTDDTGWNSKVDGLIAEIAASSPGTFVNDLYLIPGTYTFYATWTATKGAYTETFTNVEVQAQMLRGKVNNLTCSLSGNATGIVFGVEVQAWDSAAVNVGQMPLTNMALPGEFTINEAGDKVRFSRGNLQAYISDGPDETGYIYSADKWKFAENQWDVCGRNVAVGNTVDLFGWVGASSSYDSYGLLTYPNANSVYYGTATAEHLKTDWGNIPGVVSACGNGWKTPSPDELNYIINNRVTGVTINGVPNARYTYATVRTDISEVNGLILFPDGYSGGTPAGVTFGTINAVSNFTTKCTAAGWNILESFGCVFLPVAGWKNGSNVVNGLTDQGNYWTSGTEPSPGDWTSGDSTSPNGAINLVFNTVNLKVGQNAQRRSGMAVRLIRPISN